MFRYERQAFSASSELMQSVCRELNEYEEEIRSLSRMLDRNPEIPAPRHRIRKCIEKLEERETSLNLTRRKLDSVRRLYENAENRIQDMADEAEGMNSRGTDASRRWAEDNGRSGHVNEGRFDPEMNWRWPIPYPERPRFYPGFRPYPLRPYRPVVPLIPRPPIVWFDMEVLRRLLRRMLPGGRGLAPIPIPRIEPSFPDRRAVLLPYIKDYGLREVRQARLHSLFGTDRS